MVKARILEKSVTPYGTTVVLVLSFAKFNPLNTELNPICHLLALLGAHHIFHVSWLRVKLVISNFRRVLNTVRFILGNWVILYADPYLSPSFLLPVLFSSQTFSCINTPAFLSSSHTSYHLPMKMEQIECSETSAYKIETPGNYPKENIL